MSSPEDVSPIVFAVLLEQCNGETPYDQRYGQYSPVSRLITRREEEFMAGSSLPKSC